MMIKKQLGVLAAAVALASSANAAFDTGAAVLYAWDSGSNNSYFVDLDVTGQALVDGSNVVGFKVVKSGHIKHFMNIMA